MRILGTTALLVALATLAGCGDDASGTADDTPAAETTEAGPSPDDETTTPAATPAPVDLGDAELVVLSSADICEVLSVEDASLAIGTEVTQAEPSTSETPQCTYSYGGDSSTLSTFTVAVQRPDDVGGRGMQEAFDYVLDINRTIAAGTEVEEAEVGAGERAVRLTGETLTLSVVASGGRLLTIITTPDLDTTAVEALTVAAADAVE